MGIIWYKLINKKVIPCKSLEEYIDWSIKNSTIILQTTITLKIRVSTVFLGLDHGFNNGKPIVFETMIFGGKHDQYQKKYSSYKEAVQGHLIAEHIASKGHKILKAILNCIMKV